MVSKSEAILLWVGADKSERRLLVDTYRVGLAPASGLDVAACLEANLDAAAEVWEALHLPPLSRAYQHRKSAPPKHAAPEGQGTGSPRHMITAARYPAC